MLEFLDGKKTVIGSICGWLALNLPGLLGALGQGDAVWIPTVVNVLNWVATILLPIGLAHKAVKAGTP